MPFELSNPLPPSVVGDIAHGTLDTRALTLEQVAQLDGHRLTSDAARCLTDEGSTDAELNLLRRARRNRMRSMAVAATATRVAETLDAAGVEVLVYKGPPLAWQTSGSWLGRASADVDALIAPESLPAAHDALLAAGLTSATGSTVPPGRWDRYLECELVFQGWPVALDLHWRIDPTPRTFTTPFSELWQRRVQVSDDGLQVWTLGATDSLLVTAAHGARSRWTHWRWTLDALRQVEAVAPADWDAVLSQALASGSQQALAQTVAVVLQCGGVPRGAPSPSPRDMSDVAALLDEFTVAHRDIETAREGVRRRVQAWRAAGGTVSAIDSTTRSVARQVTYRVRQRTLSSGTLRRIPEPGS